MRIKIQKRYYKRSLKGRSPARFSARQSKGVGTDVHATVKLDPVLRKYPDLRKPILRHEKNEITDWGKGCTKAHTHSRKKEPKLTKNIGGISGFWKEIKRRKKR